MIRKKFSNASLPLNGKRGFGLIEIIVATAIAVVTLYTFTASAHIAFRVISQSISKTQGEFLAEEGLEVIRTLRDQSWASNISPLSFGNAYYLLFATSTNTWISTTTDPGFIDNFFNRKINVFGVYRDSNDDIVASTSPGAVLDPDTVEVKSNVTWLRGGVTLSTYLANLFNN